MAARSRRLRAVRCAAKTGRHSSEFAARPGWVAARGAVRHATAYVAQMLASGESASISPRTVHERRRVPRHCEPCEAPCGFSPITLAKPVAHKRHREPCAFAAAQNNATPDEELHPASRFVTYSHWQSQWHTTLVTISQELFSSALFFLGCQAYFRRAATGVAFLSRIVAAGFASGAVRFVGFLAAI